MAPTVWIVSVNLHAGGKIPSLLDSKYQNLCNLWMYSLQIRIQMVIVMLLPRPVILRTRHLNYLVTFSLTFLNEQKVQFDMQ